MAGVIGILGVKTTVGPIAVGRLAKSLSHAFRVDLDGAVHAVALSPPLASQGGTKTRGRRIDCHAFPRRDAEGFTGGYIGLPPNPPGRQAECLPTKGKAHRRRGK